DVLGYNHDANNTLTACLLDAEALVAIVDSERGATEEMKGLARDLASGLQQIRVLVEGIRAKGHGATLASVEEPVDVRPVLTGAIDSVRRRFPQTAFALELATDAPLRVRMNGGATNLRRVIENVVLNAAQGDGERRASAVHVNAQRDSSGARVAVVVRDDG